MPTTKQLESKIKQLQTKVTELRKQSDIDPLTSTPEQIIENAQNETQARESASELENLIAQLQTQLGIRSEQEKTEVLTAQVNEGYKSLLSQADIVTQAAAKLDEELTKLREMGTAIATSHKTITGRLALDDRLSADYRLPIVEDLGQTVIIHTEARNYVSKSSH